MYTDDKGLIVTHSQDGGDTLAEEARYWFLYWFNFVYMSNFHITLNLPQRLTPQTYMNLLEISPGTYVRNPNIAQWWSDPRQTSRDQLQPVIWYCAAYKDYARLGRLFLAVLERYCFAQNNLKNGSWKIPDQMFTCLGDFIRAGGYYTAILYPLLFVFDAINLIGILSWLFIVPNDNLIWYNPLTWLTVRSPDDTDDNNTECDLLAAVAFKPTPISWLTRKLFSTFRPKNSGNNLLYHGVTIKNNCLAAIYFYHKDDNLEVVDLFTKPILTYMRHM
jgi:hypothetical protein